MPSSLPEPGSLAVPKGGPNILLITTDEERFALPRPDGFRLAARDRLGQKPLYYTEVAGEVLLGSEIKALLAAGIERLGIMPDDCGPDAKHWAPEKDDAA